MKLNKNNPLIERVEPRSTTRKYRNPLQERVEPLKIKSDEAIVEVPILSAEALKSIEINRDIAQERVAETEKVIDEFTKEQKKKIEDSKKKAMKPLSEEYLNENFADKWSLKEDVYVVKCAGRKELRQLIAEAKANGIHYVFDRLDKIPERMNEGYKYDFKYSLSNGLEEIKEEIEQPKVEDEEENKEQELDFEKLFAQALLNLIDSYGGSLSNVLVEIGVSEPSEEATKIKEWFGWEEGPEDLEKYDESLTKENKEQELNESLSVLGKLEDYSPSKEAKELWDEITSKELTKEFEKIIEDLYPDGVSIEELNNLLGFHKSFVRGMLDLDEESTRVETEEEELPEETVDETEEETVDETETEEETMIDDEMLDRLASEEKDFIPDTNKEITKKDVEINREKYLNDDTGYEDDLSVLDDLVNKEED